MIFCMLGLEGAGGPPSCFGSQGALGGFGSAGLGGLGGGFGGGLGLAADHV